MLRNGGGYYDEEGHGIKIGKWIGLDEEFYEQKQITYHGDYKNGSLPQNRLVEDAMMKKVMLIRLGSGLIWMKDFIKRNKSLIMVSIQMGEKLGDGALVWLQENKLVVGHMMIKVRALRLESGLIQVIDMIRILKQFMLESINMVIRLVCGLFFIGICRGEIINKLVVDQMMKEVMALRLGNGFISIKAQINNYKYYIVVNITLVKRQTGGILFQRHKANQTNRLLVVIMIRLIVLKLGSGLNIQSLNKVLQLIMATMKTEKELAYGQQFGRIRWRSLKFSIKIEQIINYLWFY
ncbi:unnamed protein product [Paramecium octaurelia]|uniref:Uncharacterized protein n=1 Tax=Paramecium octaurelia TaxID=43137 RepID=A0A8S1T999_PAROT|nr:unnamed protein product [Paramecium octaurelia]CAD8148211.1 unnamed protein product [Paramecium octaurelia]